MTAKILLVDDEAHILQVLSLKLRNAGFDIVTAVDGEEAYELACQSVPDLIITDFQMPYMTGLELCCALKQNEATAEVPIIMLTARGYALDADDLASCNIKQVLSKPFSPKQIVALVSQQLQGMTHDGGTKGHSEAA